MSYIKFDRQHLVNLKYSLKREYVCSNRAGSFATSTIAGCNTRKYHGLLIVPQPNFDGGNYLLLSSLDETIVQDNERFCLGIHRYRQDVFHPKGHNYLSYLELGNALKFCYHAGKVILTKELLFSIGSDRLMIRYTLVEAHSPIVLMFKPFLAFRNLHVLTKANLNADTHYEKIKNGIKVKMYPGYSYLHLQFSKDAEYAHVPLWYYDFEYLEEAERAYDFREDLYTPGFFEVRMKKGESLVFSAGLDEVDPASLKRSFNGEIKKRVPADSYKNCLIKSAMQYFVQRNKKLELMAGFPWFGRWGRDTFISLPGLTLTMNEPRKCKAVIDNLLLELKDCLFPNVGKGENAVYNSVDAPLWFFWALQQYAIFTKKQARIWKEYGSKMRTILNGFRNYGAFNIKMMDNGLIYAGGKDLALTWMNALVNGHPVTSRPGMNVEINALWYNAIMFSVEVAKLAGDDAFVNEWSEIAGKIPSAFTETFWDDKKEYLCDYVDGDYKDWSVRPNQLIAASLPYSPVSGLIRKHVVDVVQTELLTRRGLRTLSPKSDRYIGKYQGGITQLDAAYHQGTVWPWLLSHYAEAYLKINGKSGLAHIQSLFNDFESVMREHGIASISEVYDGDPPHSPGGTPSQAWSVAALLWIGYLIDKYSLEI